MGPDSPPAIKFDKLQIVIFGLTITIEVTLMKENVNVMVDDNVVGDHVYKNPLNKEDGQPLPDRLVHELISHA